MRYITRQEYNKRKEDGQFTIFADADGKHPDWKGRVAMTFPPDDKCHSMSLCIEGVSFEVVDDDDPRANKWYHVTVVGTKGNTDNECIFLKTYTQAKTAEEAAANVDSQTMFKGVRYEVVRDGSAEVVNIPIGQAVPNVMQIDTPAGKMEIEAGVTRDKCPGAWISFTNKNGEKQIIGWVGYDAYHDAVGALMYADKELDDPTDVIEFDVAAKPKPKLKPFSVVVKETYHRNIVVYAEDENDAWNRTEGLCDSGEIELNGRDYDCREHEVYGEISESAVEAFGYVYGEEC